MNNFNFLKTIEDLKFRLESCKDKIVQKINKTWIYVFFKKKHEWIQASLLNYSVFLIFGSCWLATVRLFQIWITDSWFLLNFYYKSTTFSFIFTTIMIMMRYAKEKGYFKRGHENSDKWRIYKDYVADKHNLKWNFLFSKSIVILLPLDCAFYTFYRQTHTGELLTNIGMLIFTIIFFCYFLNHCYVVHWMRKTQIPEELLLEPPLLYKKIFSIPSVNKIFLRKYSSRPRAERLRLFYSANKKEVWATTLGIGTALWWTTGGDNTIAGFTGETSYGARAYNSTTEGWYTTDPKIKRRAHSLSWWGVDPSVYCYENSRRLDPDKLNSAYETIRDEKCPSRYRTEMRELKSRLETTKLELERQAQMNDSLARRLEALEKSKEVENR